MQERYLIVEGGGKGRIGDNLAVPNGRRVHALLLELDNPLAHMEGKNVDHTHGAEFRRMYRLSR
jgi:hypothetical protein